MNLPPSSQQQGNPQLLMAIQQVIAVSRDMESLVPQARQQGSVVVGADRIGGWQGALQSAVTQLSQIPIILIYPPPPIATLIQGAIGQLNQVIASLGAIPITASGVANLRLVTLLLLLFDLQAGIGQLFQALRTGQS
jgi:hypothetical protein